MTSNLKRSGFLGRSMRRALLAACALPFLAGAALMATPAVAQQNYLQITQAAYGATRQVEVLVNKSIIVDLPADAKEVIVSQPGIANTIMRSKRRAIIQGIDVGSTNIFFLDSSGSAISVIDITIEQQASPVGQALQDTLARVLPGSNVRVESFTDPNANKTYFVLTGTVQTAEDKGVAEALATQVSEGGEPVGSLIQVIGANQVMLKVVVAEVRRDALKELGINLSGSLQVGNVNLGFNSNQTTRPNGGVLGYDNGNGFSFSAAIRALTDRGAIKLLAEPTLTALSGSPAEFLVGGELPYEVTDQSGVATTEWKPYGVELEFTPVVKSNDIVALTINTSVSEPQADSSLTKRSVATNVELGFGQTLSIGGIIQDTVRQQISGLPGLSRIPILGALFRSREFTRNQTELVVLVTPYKAEVNAPVALPTDAYQVSTDAEAIFLGQMEKQYGINSSQFRGGYDGSVGFVLD